MINKVIKITKKIGRGFTLVETLMAVLLLSLAIAGPLTIASKSLQATLIAKDQDTAFYLAQDGIEYIWWVRDTNRLQGNADWLAGLDGTADSVISSVDGQNGDCVSSGGTQFCTVDTYANAIASCGASGAACSAINYQWIPVNGVNFFSNFTYAAVTGTTITQSIFTRTISIQTPVNGNAAAANITVTVSACGQQATCNIPPVTLQAQLWNWQ
jgi:prepilin-type N-terminal cleavage/methylation domain-containing protein